MSVESTRHTLKQKFLKDNVVLEVSHNIDADLQNMIAQYVQDIFAYVDEHPDVPNDILKYAMPECFQTSLVMTVNVRELRHIIGLRIAPQALGEFQVLCAKMFLAVPKEFQYLLEDKVLNGKEENN